MHTFSSINSTVFRKNKKKIDKSLKNLKSVLKVDMKKFCQTREFDFGTFRQKVFSQRKKKVDN